MLKRRITKDQFEALSDTIKAEYKKAAGSDNYDLDTEDGASDELKKAKDREKKRADDAEIKVREAEARLEELEGSQTGALKAEEVIKLKADHKAALDKLKADNAAALTVKHKQLEEVMLDGEALRIATDLSIVPDIFKGEVRKRLALDEVDGKPIIKVLGEDGKASDMKLEALSEEMFANEKFAPILSGGRASGGGAPGSSKTGRAAPKKLSEMTATEEAAFANEKPDQYASMIAAESAV